MNLVNYRKPEEDPEVLEGEVMESIILEEALEHWNQACLFTLNGEYYIASMGNGAGWSRREPTVFTAYKHRGEWEFHEEEFTDRTATSFNGLIYLYEQSLKKPRPGVYSTWDEFSSGTGRPWSSYFSDPVNFANDLKGQVITVEVDGKIYNVGLGDDTIQEK